MSKTTMKVRKKQWDFFNRECKAASLRRDDFLDRSLPGEIALLNKIPACDEVGALWLKHAWVRHWSSSDTDLQPVPLLLSDDVINKLNSVCAKKAVPRDAFFDCALAFLSARLYEAVIVIKDPRTNADLISQLSRVYNDPRDELTIADRERFVAETVEEWQARRDLVPFTDDFYRTRLSYDEAKVDAEKMRLVQL